MNRILLPLLTLGLSLAPVTLLGGRSEVGRSQGDC